VLFVAVTAARLRIPTAGCRSRIAANNAVVDSECAATGVVGATALGSRVAAKSTAGNSQHTAVEGAATQPSTVAAHSAIGNDERCGVLIVHTATGRAGMTVPDREAGYRDGFT